MAVLLFSAQALNASTPIATNSVHLSEPKSSHVIQGKVTDANDSVTALEINLQRSPEGREVVDASAGWETITTENVILTSTDKTFDFTVVNQPAKRIRVTISTVTGTAAAIDTINLWYQEGSV